MLEATFCPSHEDTLEVPTTVGRPSPIRQLPAAHELLPLLEQSPDGSPGHFEYRDLRLSFAPSDTSGSAWHSSDPVSRAQPWLCKNMGAGAEVAAPSSEQG